jgi:hypothetical protein
MLSLSDKVKAALEKLSSEISINKMLKRENDVIWEKFNFQALIHALISGIKIFSIKSRNFHKKTVRLSICSFSLKN